MPIYEYRCKDCGNSFSRLQKIGASADGVKCPKCAGEKVERLFSSFASRSSGDAPPPSAHTCGSGFS